MTELQLNGRVQLEADSILCEIGLQVILTLFKLGDLVILANMSHTGTADFISLSVTDEAQLESLVLGVSDGRRHQVGW